MDKIRVYVEINWPEYDRDDRDIIVHAITMGQDEELSDGETAYGTAWADAYCEYFSIYR